MNKRLAQSIQDNFLNLQNPSHIPDRNSQSDPNNEQQLEKTIENHKKNIPNFLKHANDLNNSSDSIKHLLLDRFKQRKQILQSTSIYIDTGEIKKKNHSKDKNQIISELKETSLEKLPYLSKQKPNFSSDRFSKTIDTYPSLNKSFFSEITKNDSNPSTLALESNKTFEMAKMHLSKRKSLNESHEIQISFILDQNKSEQNIRTGSPFQRTINYLGFNEEMKKKYLKSIVDRYFPNSEFENAEKQMQLSKTSSKRFPNKEQLQPKRSIKSKRQSLRQGKLPSLKSVKKEFKSSNQPPRQNEKSQCLQSEDLNYFPPSEIIQGHPTEINSIIKQNSSALSLSQSYFLEKIEEDEEEIERHKIEDFYKSSALYNSFRSQDFSQLSHQTSTEIIINNSSNDLIGLAKDHQSNFSPKHKEQRIKIYENRSFSIFKVKHTFFQNTSQNHDLKTLSVSYEFTKHFLNEPSMELKRRELKAKQIILNLCGPCFGQMWQEDLFDKNCIKLNITKNSPPCPEKMLPLTLSKLLYKISPQIQNGSSSFLLVKPNMNQQPTPFITQQSLLENSHQGLLSLLLNLSLSLSQLSQILINNRISLNNIFFRDFNSFAINQWSYSYFKQEFLIQDKKFEKRLEPILKNQFDEWFVTPEYLAPQILENLCFSKDEVIKYWVKREGKKMEKSIVKEHDLFEFGNKSDVWSMGLMILEIITLIPVWIGQKCMVQNRKNPSITPRKGFLYSQKRDLLKVLTKQSYLKENLNKILRVESQPYQIEEWLGKLLHRMLELDAQKRISFIEIIKILKSEEKKMKQ